MNRSISFLSLLMIMLICSLQAGTWLDPTSFTNSRFGAGEFYMHVYLTEAGPVVVQTHEGASTRSYQAVFHNGQEIFRQSRPKRYAVVEGVQYAVFEYPIAAIYHAGEDQRIYLY